jgi:hypothetical protein
MSIVPLGRNKKLKEAMPKEFSEGGEYDDTKAFGMIDEFVLYEHGCMFDQIENELKWPGKQKNVHFWVELANGFIVGWNENPSRGWSFPVMKNPYHPKITMEEWGNLVAYYKEKYKGV